MQIIKYIILLATLSLLASCANVLAPTGGPADRTAPVLKKRSMADSALNFTSGKVRFEFDEFIQADKIRVTTTPFTKGKPKIIAGRSSFEVQFDDSMLAPNTTYRVSFGNTIVDVNEGNPLDNLSFCFSTGPSLDTLGLLGKVIFAESALPDTSAWVQLYPNITSDSDIVHTKPMYAVKVNSEGIFKFDNLPKQEFYLYTVGDINANYLLDLSTERVGFIPMSVLPSANVKDAVITVRSISQLPDTFIAVKPKRSNIRRLTLNIDTADSKKRTYDITAPITLNFSQPLRYYNLSKIRLFGPDGVLDETGIVRYDSIAQAITMNFDLLKDTLYTLQLLDSFAVDSTKFEAAKFVFRTKRDADYGTLKVSFGDEVDIKNKILQLQQSGKIVSTQIVKQRLITFNLLNPGTYELVLIHDDNANGKWDNGTFLPQKKPPEIVERRAAAVQIKANWENKVTF